MSISGKVRGKQMMERGMGDIEGIYWLGIAFLAFWLAVMIFLLKPLFSGEYTNLSGDDLVYTRLMPEEPFRIASHSNTSGPSSPAKILERTKTMKARRKSLYTSQEQLMCRRWLAQQTAILGTLNSEDEPSDENSNDACTTLPAITVIGSSPVQSFDDASPSDAATTNYDVQVEVHTVPENTVAMSNQGRNPNMSLLTLPEPHHSRLPSSASWCCTPRCEQFVTTPDVNIPKLNLSCLDEPVQTQTTSPDFETATEHSRTNESFVTARSHLDSKLTMNPQSSTRSITSRTCYERTPLLKRQTSFQTRHNYHHHHKPKSKQTIVVPLQDDHVEQLAQAELPNCTAADACTVSQRKHTAVTEL